ncbi:MAG: DUF1302 domain-containing protein, partial [Salinisphaera sp.]|nr:DUF1302 domain-containing protein [Salinisphaera sp.]
MGARHHRIWPGVVVLLVAALWAPPGHALRYSWDALGGITATLNTRLSLGAQWRLEEPSKDIVAVANINPAVCRSLCQPHASTEPGDVPGRIQLGLEGEGNFVNQLSLNAPGSGSINFDNGTLNYDQYEMTQGVAQIGQDLKVEFAQDVGPISDILFFIRWHGFHDFVNYNRECYFPNFYTPEDRARDDARRSNGRYGFPSVGSSVYRDCGDKWNDYLGQNAHILDAFVKFRFPVPFLPTGAQLTIGEQTINWGESTLLVVNSLNTINPPNVNALFRPAFISLATVFEPIGAIKLSAPLTYNTSFQIFYQYDWEKVQIPPRGGFLSITDITLGRDVNNINPGFGKAPDDPEGNLRAEQQLLTAVANVDGQVPVYEESASDGGQYGAAFTWYLPDLINGTEFRFYYANYHSRLPYLSMYAGAESCLQAAPTGNGLNDTLSLLTNCSNADKAHFLGPLLQSAAGGNALAGAVATALGTLVNGLPVP